MEIRKWWQELKKEKERKKLVQAAKELEAKADSSLPKKKLPENKAVKQRKRSIRVLLTRLYKICRKEIVIPNCELFSNQNSVY